MTKFGTRNSNQSVFGKDNPLPDEFYQCYYGCISAGRPPPYCEHLCLPSTLKSE